MKNIFLNLIIVSLFSSIAFVSCQKETSHGSQAKLKIYLTDAPGDYEAVYIDVKGIMINVTGDSLSGWQNLTGVNTGVYNLLQLINDNDTLLADAEIPSGRIHQLRLVLGTENYVKIEGTTPLIKLETPSAQQSGLKLNIQQDVVNGVLYTILLDFDVAKSIVKTGSNKYILKPVIRTILQAVGGSVKGVVRPNSFPTAVYAVQAADTIASTFTALSGGYIFKGLLVGNYSLHFNASDTTYVDSVRNNISVSLNMMTVVDTMFLHQ